MVGGGAGLMGAVFLGPRHGRFGTVRTSEQGTTIAIPGHSAILSTLGVFIIWTGWYGFNAASTLCMYKCMGIALRAAVNTTISAAAGGCFTLFVHVFIFRRPAELAPLMNGVLGGPLELRRGQEAANAFCLQESRPRPRPGARGTASCPVLRCSNTRSKKVW